MENTVFAVLSKASIVKGYRKVIYNQYRLGGLLISTNTNKNYTQVQEEIKNIILNLSKQLGFEPIKWQRGQFHILRWVNDKKVVALYLRYYNNGADRWQCIIVQEISEQ